MGLTFKGAADEFDRWYKSLTSKQLREIEKVYRESLKEAKQSILVYFEKYGKDGKLTLVEMEKYGRMKNMYEDLTKEINHLTKKKNGQVQALLFDIYDRGYNYPAWLAEQATGLNIRWYGVPKGAVRKAMENPISGLTLAEHLERHRRDIVWRIRQEVTQGLVRGESYYKTSRRLAEAFESDYVKAKRVVWTESHRVKEQAQLESHEKLKEKGLEAKRMWVATLDDRTRDTHRELDGKYEDRKGLFHIRGLSTPAPGMFGIAEEDINCRCTVVYVYEDYEPAKRMARGEGLRDYVTYEQWVKEKL